MIDPVSIDREWERLNALLYDIRASTAGLTIPATSLIPLRDELLALLEKCISLGGSVDDPVVRSRLQTVAREVSNAIFSHYSEYKPSSILPYRIPQTQIWNGMYLSETWPQVAPTLYGREQELDQLEAIWKDDHTNIVVFIGFGGIGKTSLVTRWLLDRFLGSNEQRPPRIFAWSFVNQEADSQQASVDEFFDEAFRRFEEPGRVVESSSLAYPAKGQRLAELVRTQPTLLVLDSLEPFQNNEDGSIVDQAVRRLLSTIALGSHESLCIVTTRLKIADLAQFPAMSVKQVVLPALQPEAASMYLGALGVRGSKAERMEVAAEYDGHPLTLTLLGRYLSVVYQGDIRSRDRIPGLLSEHSYGSRARLILEGYESWFAGKPAEQVLYILSLFDHVVKGSEIQAVISDLPIKGLTDHFEHSSGETWKYAVAYLVELQLLTIKSPDYRIDCSPLVREHFAAVLRRKDLSAWQEAHRRLYAFYTLQAIEYPESIEEMRPLFRAVRHGCLAGNYLEVWDAIYIERIQRRHLFYNTRKLGAISDDLALLANFFDRPWNKPAKSVPIERIGILLHHVGFDLRELGRLDEAAEALGAALDAYVTIENWEYATRAAGHLSNLYLAAGDLIKAEEVAEHSLYFAGRIQDPHKRLSELMKRLAARGSARHQQGKVNDALVDMRQAESLQMEADCEARHPFLYSLRGYQYCDLLFDMGKWDEVSDRAESMLQRSTENNWPMDIALAHLILARLKAVQLGRDDHGNCGVAAGHLSKAIGFFHNSEHQALYVQCLIEKAILYGSHADLAITDQALAEALEITARTRMRLLEVDIYIQQTESHLRKKDPKLAKVCLLKASELIDRTGYHRKDLYLLLLEARIEIMEGNKSGAAEGLARAKSHAGLIDSLYWGNMVAEVEEALRLATSSTPTGG